MRKPEMAQGDLKHNLTAVTLVNNTTKLQDMTVPTGRRWKVFFGGIYNGDDVARNLKVAVRESGGVAEIIPLLATVSTGASTNRYFPKAFGASDQVALGAGAYPFWLEAGDVIRFTFTAGGASAGGTGYVWLSVIEVPL